MNSKLDLTRYPILKRITLAVIAVCLVLAVASLIAGFISEDSNSQRLHDRNRIGTKIGVARNSGVSSNIGTTAVKSARAIPARSVADINKAKIDKTNGKIIESDIGNQSFSIAAVGDVNCADRVASVIAKNGIDYPYRNVRNLLSSVDMTIGNLECPLSSRGKAIAGKKFTFRGSPECGPALKRAGFDFISMANNHSKDFGAAALEDTTKILEKSGVVFAGAGSNSATSYQPKFVTIKGTKTAFLAFSDVVPPGFAAAKKTPGIASIRDNLRVAAAVKQAKSTAEFVIVSVHWGKELAKLPSSRQISLAHRLIDQGADLIIGHHPHVVQGFEVYKGKLIAYSLGNFVFSPANNFGRQSAILTVTVRSGEIATAHVYPVYIDGIQPKILTGTKGEAWLREIAGRSQIFKVRNQIGTVRGQPIMKMKVSS